MQRIFISYGREPETNNFVQKLHDEMLIAGFDPWLDTRDITVGEWMKHIERGLHDCDALAFVATRKSLASEICKLEWTTVDELGKPIIPILIAADTEFKDMPERLQAFNGLDFRSNFEREWAELKRRIEKGQRDQKIYQADAFQPAEPPPSGTLMEPGKLPPNSRLPYLRNAVFKGRTDDLLALAESLLHGQNTSINAATGAGGIGKSQLAVEFAYRYGRCFHGVHWVSAAADIGAEIVACGREMFDVFPESFPEQLQLTLRTWQQQPQRLIILDNLEEEALLREWLPHLGEARVLITSRRGRWAPELGLNIRKLDTLAPEACRDLLRDLAPHLAETADAELDQLTERLGHLPLAVDLAGRYMAEMEQQPSDYLREIEQSILDHPSLVDWAESNPTQHDVNVAASFQLSYDRLQSDAARRLFAICGELTPNQPIPRGLLERCMMENPQEDPDAEAKRGTAKALRELSGVGLLRDSDGLSIHPLLADFARAQGSVLAHVADALSAESELASKRDLPSDFSLLQSHMLQAAARAEKRGLDVASDLWNNLGYHLKRIADYIRATKYYNQALELDKAKFGLYNQKVAIRLSNLGSLLYAQGDYAAAKEHFQRALTIDEAAFEPHHPKVAIRLNNLGSVLQAQGDYDAAKEHFQRALTIDEAAFGPHHLNVAVGLSNLGGVLTVQGYYNAAKDHFQHARDIFKNNPEANNIYIAVIDKHFGKLLQAQGHYDAAKECFQRALTIDEAAFGPHHPQVALGRNNLGELLLAQGHYDAAKDHFQRALAINETIFNTNHPQVARGLNNLGLVLKAQGQYEAAREHYQRALQIWEAALGDNHPRVATGLNNLGLVLKAQGQYEAAREHYQRALTIDEAAFGPHHPNVAISLNNLGMVLKAQGQYEAAREHYQRALRIFEATLPPAHPNIQVVKNHLAALDE